MSRLCLASLIQETSRKPWNGAKHAPVVKQLSHWDCGIACITSCVAVATRTPAQRQAEVRKALPEEAINRRSVWTVDLAYGLKELGVGSFMLTTTSAGVDPSHQDMGFYAAGFDEDERRVNDLIANAPQNNVDIAQRSVPLDELAAFVAVPGNMAIALVNSFDLDNSVWSCITRYWTGSFVGHYIVLYDYSKSGGFVCMDPASRFNAPRLLSEAVIDRARMARGTDEDLILIWGSGVEGTQGEETS
eukprot:TRINITY_DN9194_c0_g1_i6.p1 TRINITY_DN9194_c0_g1~~TRINITY_DN9194_c0_g1_i6.p1  ORF type:complete len:246 (-),score=51.88 TRINITY_DN9194_c0_g1_i6:106-843(-)